MRFINLLLCTWIAGVAGASCTPVLPSRALVLAIALLSALCAVAVYGARRHRIAATPVRTLAALAALLAGAAWALHAGHAMQERRLPDALAGQDLVVDGVVINLPERTLRGERFDFAVLRVVRAPGAGLPVSPGKLRLNTYEATPATDWRYRPGERWQLTVRLRPPRGFVNPQGFDYEGWLLQQGYGAAGYVRASPDNHRLAAALTGASALALRGIFDRAALACLDWMHAHIDDRARRALFAAIALGYQQEFSHEDWDRLRNTGTIHLVVVSGLNIALAGVTGFALAGLFARALVLPLWLAPAPVWGAVGALVAAVLYAGLTGFSLPAQRSLAMVLCGLAPWLFRRHVAVSTAFLAALALVFALDPLAATTASLWLSFGAVAVLLYAFGARTMPSAPNASRAQAWRTLLLRAIATQCAVSFGLFPFLAVWIGDYPLVTPLANLLAVPWATFVLLPLACVVAAVALVAPHSQDAAFALAAPAFDAFWRWLDLMQQANHNVALAMPALPLPVVLALSFGAVLVLLAPPGVFASRAMAAALALGLALPLLVPMRTLPPPGEFRLVAVDVGQGLALLVETRNGVMVYDTGDRFSEQFDAGRDLLAAMVRRAGYRRLDTVVVSHADADHAGGLAGLLGTVPATRLLSGNADVIATRLAAEPALAGRTPPVEACVRGQSWQQDGVAFEMLAPAPGQPGARRNNLSCVLRIHSAHLSVLVAGDIEAAAEATLVASSGDALASDLLVVPHHGSRSSSSPDFLHAVHPALALASVGYANAYGHPHPEIVARYRAFGIPLLRTDESGAVTLDSADGVRAVHRARQESGAYWHRF